ncbi:MAG: hypothetical protein Q7T08_06595 [Devosia sp.]|nr:hypothetical protein [Devosia sp.]
MSGAALLETGASRADLPAGSTLKRLPRSPRRPRPQAFLDAFDAQGLVYDCFRHADGRRVLLVGPPPVNLMHHWRGATFAVLPGRSTVRGRFHISVSVMITELLDVPQDAREIEMMFDGASHILPIQPNTSAELSGRRVLFSMNKDNDLAWIREWALFHARLHGTDTVILFDNGSRRYAVGDVEETLRSVLGLTHVAVPVWTQNFGRTDPVVRVDPYWAHFPQIAAMSVVLRRYGAAAAGLLNCDIDELARRPEGGSIYDAASRTKHGLAVFRGQWIEAVPEAGGPARDHSGFRMRLADPRRALARPNKWALDPRRAWVANLGVHPYWHWIAGRPLFGKVSPAGSLYWHFRGINTNWKADRTSRLPPPGGLEPDPDLGATFAALESL